MDVESSTRIIDSEREMVTRWLCLAPGWLLQQLDGCPKSEMEGTNQKGVKIQFKGGIILSRSACLICK